MSEYDDRGRGTLFLNDNKTNPRQPDWSGPLTLEDGTQKRLSAWLSETRSGKVLRLAISDPRPPRGQSAYQPQSNAHTARTQAYARQVSAQDEEMVEALGPNGKATRMPRQTAINLGLQILQPEPVNKTDEDVPW